MRQRVGIVGLSPSRGWAMSAHIPALRALSDDYEITSVANTTLESATAAAQAFGIAHAFASVEAMAASPYVDLVVVTVKVPHHRAVVETAIRHGKSVYCEWPLGNGLQEAIELAALAREHGTLAVIGTQAIASPEVAHVAKLVKDGYVGEVLASTYIGAGFIWGDEVSESEAYAVDAIHGVTLLSVIGGHAMSAIQFALGDIADLSACLEQRRRTVKVIETGATIPMKSADQLLVAARLASGAPVSIQLRGGLPLGTRLLWEIHGTEGDLRVTARISEVPVINISSLKVEGARKGETELREIEVPTSDSALLESGPVGRNVASVYRMMARDLRDGTRTAPNFDAAVKLHRLVAAVEQSAQSGKRTSV
jgi:predicted dehydrogenase